MDKNGGLCFPQRGQISLRTGSGGGAAIGVELLAQACSSIYFTLEGLNLVHFLYQYSLQFFLDIFTDVLANANAGGHGATDYAARLAAIAASLIPRRPTGR